jgi:hypothetical protein
MISPRSVTLAAGEPVFESSALERVGVLVVASVLAACHASAKASVSANATTSADDDRKYETPEPASPAPTGGTRPMAVTAPTATADRTIFLGVVHDLTLAAGAAHTPACRCLAVAYGAPTDPKFAWQSGPPRVEPGTMAVAIAADGISCSAPGFAPSRASISGVERAGDDIVLVVENVKEGRPVMHGALVAAPGGKGSLVVRARRGAPYGAPPNGGAGPCRVSTE